MMATSDILEKSVHRFGLTEVYTSTGSQHVDIVFVHGLNGHPYHTWTSEKFKIFWPAHLLPRIIEEEKARILVYGYDADVTSFTDGASKDKIHNHAENLIATLNANRRIRKATQHPIIFVAHSLGGLVTEHLRSVFVSTFGILFLGTPHKGSDIAKWDSRLEWMCDAVLPSELVNTQPQLADALKTNNETLQNIDRQFIQLTSRFCIYFFHEGKPTNLKGILRFIVDEESSSPNIQDVERASIQQDHFHMCKFENESAPGFQLVAEAIQRFAGQAPETIERRWDSERAERRARKKAEVEEIIPGMNKRKRSESVTIFPDALEAVKPLFLVPFNQDPSFINRIDVFNEIAARVQKQHRRVALSGIGGVGKSQIAIEYCYQFRDDYPNAHIVWVHASTKQRFSQEYGNIARKLQIPGWNNPNVDTLNLVFEWFNEADNGPWLMILDNADDLDTFCPSSILAAAGNERALPLKTYLPQSSRGLLLITTRDKLIGERLAGSQASIAVHRMSFPEALESQTNRLASLNIDESKTLLDALGYIPLAITQAAAFISENSITHKKYVENFFINDSEILGLLDEDFGDLRRDSESQNSIIRTWKMSFDLINKQKPRAAEMLSLMAVLDRQEIPESPLKNDTDQEVDITTALGTLKAFSLISGGDDGRTYELHRLVQLATRKWLEMQDTKGEWQERAFFAVADMFPSDQFQDDWSTCEYLLPHAQVVLQYKDNKEMYPKHYSYLLCRVAAFHVKQKSYEIALTMSLDTFEWLRKIFGLEHEFTLYCMDILSVIHREQGRTDEAEKLQMQVLETRQKTLKAEHPDILDSMENLALTYLQQGRCDEAEKLQLQVMKTRQKMLKAEHPYILDIMENLASTYLQQGRLDEAEKLQMQAMKIRQKTLKAEHPDMLINMHNLALIYKDQDRHEEAIALMEKTVDLKTKVLGANHQHTIMAVNALKGWLDNQTNPTSSRENSSSRVAEA